MCWKWLIFLVPHLANEFSIFSLYTCTEVFNCLWSLWLECTVEFWLFLLHVMGKQAWKGCDIDNYNALTFECDFWLNLLRFLHYSWNFSLNCLIFMWNAILILKYSKALLLPFWRENMVWGETSSKWVVCSGGMNLTLLTHVVGTKFFADLIYKFLYKRLIVILPFSVTSQNKL